MPIPVVVIVGRPNVGKSSLFNRLAGRRIAIVVPSAVVTRDRDSTLVVSDDRYFELVDTGGIGIVDEADLSREVERQIQIALDEADLILFTVDVSEGLTAMDRDISKRIRELDKPVIVVANKADSPRLADAASEFHELGFVTVLAVSATHSLGTAKLLEVVVARLPQASDEGTAAIGMKLAIVGKRNVGKSTLVNTIVKIFTGSENQRVIVSDIPGTTRDAIDIRFEKDGLTYLAIDTAGARKKSKVGSDVEFYSLVRAEGAVRRADVVLLLIDAAVPVGTVDKHLARYVLDHNKPCIIVVNKWDLVAGRATTGEYGDYLQRELAGTRFVPLAFTTATDGRNVGATIDLARSLFKQAGTRVSTSKINQVIQDAIEKTHPPSPRGKQLRIYYGTQVSTHPPTMVMFVNDPERCTQAYQRYLENSFRQGLPFSE
ncbi:MAG: ribosome biogenesis GTPase Der, partial [Planctomycetia bacterium]|nr:ribosome biogenesis GTPase Der [Planctomycetia bacterium]